MTDPRQAVALEGRYRERAFQKRGRFMKYVQQEPNSGCWLWSGTETKGYGRFSIFRRQFLAHRVSYELHVGPIAKGLVIDHRCKTTFCVNPAHLECVTQAENMRRGRSQFRDITHCKRGHEFTVENTNYFVCANGGQGRRCRQCNAERQRTYKARKALASAGAP